MTESGNNIGKIFIGTFDVRKPRTLTEGTPIDEMNAFESIAAHFKLAESVAIDYFDRYREILDAKLEKISGFAGKVAAKYEHAIMLSQVEKASRFVNTVKKLIADEDGEAGEFRKACHEVAKHSDHGRKHERNFRKGMKWMLLQRSHIFMCDTDAFSLKQEQKSAKRLDQMRVAAPYVLMRVGETHDEGQLHAAIWNDSLPDKSQHLRPKDLHEMFAGLLAVLDDEKYAKARGFDEERAKLIGNMLLYTIIGHGDPRTFLDTRKATRKAYMETSSGTLEIEDNSLFELVENETLDWTSISRSQYLKIVQHSVKQGTESGKIKVFDTPSGLHPLLHKHFEETGAFERLRNDHTPMFINIEPEERELLMEMRSMVLVVDLGEMVLPPLEAGLRKFIVKKSEEREIFASVNPMGDAFDVEKYAKQLLEIDGHSCKSDFERTFYEEFQYLKIVKDSGLLDDPNTKMIIAELLMDGFCGAYWMFEQFMNPDAAEVTKSIRTMFNVQVYELISKALKKNKSGITLNWDEIVERGWLNESGDELIKRYSTFFSPEEYATLERRAHDFSELQDKTIKVVQYKWQKSKHSEEERTNASYLFNTLAREFADQLDIPAESIFVRYSEWQMGNLVQNVRRSKMPWVGTGVYLGKPELAKLI